jgi:predicted AAA+ superfamily ATPase
MSIAALSPSQQRAYEDLLAARPTSALLALTGLPGSGKSTVVRHVHQALGGVVLTAKDFVNQLAEGHPLALEEALYKLLVEALRNNDHVLVDDFDLAIRHALGCGFYPRAGLVDAPLTALAALAAETNKTLLLATAGQLPPSLAQRCTSVEIDEFEPDDYSHFLAAFLGEAAGQVDAERLHRFAPGLNAHQLRAACTRLLRRGSVDTDTLIEFLQSQQLFSNVHLEEVEPVDFADLKGIDDVIERLEAGVIIPLENEALSGELGLRPKRGVLLLGPPGTGKTSIGRALAQRLKGKFFRIDGTFLSDAWQFGEQVAQLFEFAQMNAPAVVFIDDSDVLFESEEHQGVYRYLLTTLDGLESKSAGRVCVIFTANDVGKLPPALVRSGRIELWLELKMPDAAARTAILERSLASLPESLRPVDIPRLVAASEGCTGADLKRAVEDGKSLYASDRVHDRPLRSLTDYLLDALATLRADKQAYARARLRRWLPGLGQVQRWVEAPLRYLAEWRRRRTSG